MFQMGSLRPTATPTPTRSPPEESSTPLLVAKSLAMPELLFEVDAIAVPDRV
jgi:hypothetical protein